MKGHIIRILAGMLLIIVSAAIYILQVTIFKDSRNTVFYLLQDLAFIPIQVLLLTVILNSLINMRQRRELIKKMNMVIGAFFTEVGTSMIKLISNMHIDNKAFSEGMLIGAGWDNKKFKETANGVGKYKFGIEVSKANLEELNLFLVEKRPFILGLFENANLMEHDTFTDMLWAVFHVSDELGARKDFEKLPKKDYEHLAGDVSRAYGLLIFEWLYYMRHLKSDYPYLYSLAARKNPFDESAKVIID